MVLDTFMYLDYKEAREGLTLNEILKDMEKHPDYGGGGIHFGEYKVLKEAAVNDEVGELVIGCLSVNMGYDSGTAACTFQSPDESSIYVVYRGTGDGEWPDNGIGMTDSFTIQQVRALSYFDEVVERMDIGEGQRLIVTGHSKGGNKAQFVTMETKYAELIDACYSVDGQGFSEAAIVRWKEKYGKDGYENRTGRINGIHGENDYVSVLGNSIIPKENIRYVKTPVEKTNFAGYHDIKYMFATLSYDGETGDCITSFHGRKNSDTGGQGELGIYAASLSAGVMNLAPERRDGCAAVIMQLMEAAGGRKTGINGERLNLSDIRDFTLQGIPLIAGSLLKGEEGRGFLGDFLSKEPSLGQMPGSLILKVNSKELSGQAEKLRSLSGKIEKLTKQTREAANALPFYMKGSAVCYHRIKLSADEIEKLNKKLLKIAQFQGQCAESYEKWDRQLLRI